MASKNDTKEKPKGGSTGVIIAIVIVALALIAGVMWYMYNKGSNANAALPNVGTPAPTGNAAVASMPSPSNVSAGNGNAAGGRVGAQV